jgi:hypothetical protein
MGNSIHPRVPAILINTDHFSEKLTTVNQCPRGVAMDALFPPAATTLGPRRENAQRADVAPADGFHSIDRASDLGDDARMVGQLAEFVCCWFAECEVVLDHHEMAAAAAERDVHRHRPKLRCITDRLDRINHGVTAGAARCFYLDDLRHGSHHVRPAPTA